MDPTPAQFGSYRLLERLGEGGMGVVWKAMDVRLERVVALKVMKGGEESTRKALVQEAKTACQLNHPNIAVIYDAGEVDGAPYIAMELVEGQSLREYAGRSVPEDDLREILAQAAAALQQAHAKGVIHRDIKPENLLITHGGALKILDFGVAKRTLPHAQDTTSSGFTVTEATGLGISVGTPAYMSPEQAYGLGLGPATDQFSLGTVIYEIASGRHPFRRDTMLDTLHSVAKESPEDLRLLRPDLSPALVRIINRMLEKRPELRFRSMQALLDGLKGDAMQASTGRVRTLPAPRRSLPALRTWALAGAVLAAVAVLGWSGWKAFGGGGTRQDLGRGKRVVAILPVEMLGVAADQQWVGASLQDAMATSLLRRGDLLILDRMRTTAALARVGNSQGRLDAVVKDLGADLLLLGTLRAAEGQYKLSLRVVQGRTGEMLNQLGVSGSAADALLIEEELGRRLPPLLGEIQGTSAGPVSKARRARTRELYTKGVELMELGKLSDTSQAVKLFEEALAAEPAYAPARAGLSWALLDLSSRGTHLGLPEAKTLTDQAVAEARRAVADDPELGSAQRVLGQALVRLGDFPGARVAAEKAVALDPGDYRALVVLADSYAYSDAPDGHRVGRTHYQRALELFPNDWWGNYRLAVLLQNDGELQEAVRCADRARLLQPSAEYAHLTAGICLTWLGDYPQATRRIEDGLRQAPGSGLLRATLAVLQYATGNGDGFRASLAGLKERWPEEHAVSLLLKGMEQDLAGNRPLMRRTYLDFATWSARRSMESLSTGERRTSSVNCYQMARILAMKGDPEAARTLLAEAERLHAGKLQVARQDSILKQLK